MADPYKILGVLPDTSAEEISKAYRKLAKKYHPDVNQGSPEAAKKMSEINAAYEQIKSGNVSPDGDGQYGDSGPGEYGNAGYGTSSNRANDPFGFGFDPFEAFFGGAGYRGSGQGQATLQTAENYIRAGFYPQALAVLDAIAERGAQWYYYSAVANSGVGNMAAALEHAKIAARMEPDNQEYRLVLDRLQNSGSMYRRRESPAGKPLHIVRNVAFAILVWNFLSLFFGRLFY
ncbi:MAG TPA: DnaJ domain-containing protein [Rectinemataceae bacterium]|nr:DnaJ domain-containing protein [Rectinemataceae bacterium]